MFTVRKAAQAKFVTNLVVDEAMTESRANITVLTDKRSKLKYYSS